MMDSEEIMKILEDMKNEANEYLPHLDDDTYENGYYDALCDAIKKIKGD